MKRIILAAALVLGFAVAASAQPKALGIRGGYGVELSYQHYVGGEANFIEADLGLGDFKFLNVAATYNFMISQFGDGFGFYAGPGLAVGLGESLHIGVAGQCGIEYNFDFPLQLSLDVRPQLGLVNEAFGIWGWYPHLGIRYKF